MLCPNCEANHALGQEIGKYPANVPGGKSFCWALMSLLPHSDPAVVLMPLKRLDARMQRK